MAKPNSVLIASKIHALELQKKQIAAEISSLYDDLIACYKFEKAEGQETFDIANKFGKLKVVLKRDVSTRIDAATWERVRKLIPKKVADSIVRVKYELAAKEAREFQERDADGWAKISPAIVRTPKDVDIEIKSLELAATEGSAGEVPEPPASPAGASDN